MNNWMMDFQLNLRAIMQRAETFYGHKEIVTRLPDRSFHRYTYDEFLGRAKRLALALRQLGIQPDDRVASLCWNQYQHLEAYFGVPAFGAVLHTLNPRWHPSELAYVANHAEDKAILVDETLLPLFEQLRQNVNLQHTIVISHGGATPDGLVNYEELLASANESDFQYHDLNENQPAMMCYTSGTTGRPKGVVYTHRALALHALVVGAADSWALREADVVLPVVPMYHVNAWGLPHSATLFGAKQVLPGPHLDPLSLLENLQAERVTLTAGVPTVWFGVLDALDKDPKAYDLSCLRAIVSGGAAIPRSVIEAFENRHGLKAFHAWGMTETTPLGFVCNLTTELQQAPREQQARYRAKQGMPVPFFEIRARNENGLVPWDGRTMGELEVRGPCVAGTYFNNPESTDRFTEDGWFRTGDIVTITSEGYVEIQDRTKDLIKSGGEWISSVALENALMGHPAVAEAAVIALPHPKWQERPLAVVVLRKDHTATTEELVAYLKPMFPKWWLPDAVEFIDAIPRTAAGKFLKSALRERLWGYELGFEKRS
ncbi:MAG: long-chain fatty acid--CoA ligase [Chloroflexi bacterium]|nr:long-chain fatty acid--CoA ligase [Chloroflexota bacterium]